MPIFEYRCPECSHQFEQLVRNAEAVVCPHCRSVNVEKLLSAAAGRVGASLPVMSDCPPPDAGPCGPACCRLPG